MTPSHSDTLEALLVATHRLTRLAAQETGSTTPAAVWRTLSILETEGGMRVGELAASSRVSQPAMTKLLRELISDEHVYRIADSDDSRAWTIAITPKGARALEAWRTRLADTLVPHFSDLDTADWALLEGAARLLTRHLGHAVAAA